MNSAATQQPAGDLGIIARTHAAIGEIDAAPWNDLLARQSQPTPFLRHEYLHALEHSGSASPASGWQPCHITLWRGTTLLAACPMYLKSHSRGEYVFDFAWAQAYHAHGKTYYPKALVASPFTPVPGSRLLASDATSRTLLLHTLITHWQAGQLETAHLLFLSEDDQAACRAAGLLLRPGLQFHWRNRDPRNDRPFADFDSFLNSLQRDKRRKARQEMRRVAEAGIRYRHAHGHAITDADWAFFYQCYQTTYLEHGNAPYLRPQFWQTMQREMAAHWLLVIAEHHDRPIACSLIGLHDPQHHGGSETIAYGRYWGALERVHSLHFDLCYYQPLAWCIRHGIDRFEGGAQGEHKLSRALLPQATQSAHWISDTRFKAAIADFLQHERDAMADYEQLLQTHSPFKQQ